MTRFKALWRASPRKVLLAFGGLLIAAALAVDQQAGGAFGNRCLAFALALAAGALTRGLAQRRIAAGVAYGCWRLIRRGTRTLGGPFQLLQTGAAAALIAKSAYLES